MLVTEEAFTEFAILDLWSEMFFEKIFATTVTSYFEKKNFSSVKKHLDFVHDTLYIHRTLRSFRDKLQYVFLRIDDPATLSSLILIDRTPMNPVLSKGKFAFKMKSRLHSPP